MKYARRFFLVVMIIISCAETLSAQQENTTKVSSPDKNIVLTVALQGGQLYYQISLKKQPVITKSKMGMMVNNMPFTGGSSVDNIEQTVIRETYPWRGIKNTAINYCNDAKIKITGEDGSSSFTIETRVFNDGVAFRYIIPQESDDSITDDLTEFSIPKGSIIWSQPSVYDYEGNYVKQPVEQVKAGQTAGPPVTVLLPDKSGYAAITEGGLVDFAGMSLTATGTGKFKATLAGTVKLKGDIKSPWRVIEIGKDLNTLVNCDIIHNVSPQPDRQLFPEGFNTPWIQPGKAVWSWLAGNGRVTFENMKRFSQWAGELGFAYNLVDSGWWKWHEDNKDRWALLRELVQYADSQHVKIWVWKNYQDRGGIPGLKHPDVRREVFEKCKQAGVVGLKIDYLGKETEEVMKFYQDALKEAAEMHLMIDFHGAAKPVGAMRTWPNEMTREAIRGLEYGSIPGKSTDWATHNTTLPFTRFLAGHADYTPVSFRSNIKGTTRAHQVASMAVFTSSLMCLAIDPEMLLTNPCKKMIQRIPTTWDETIVLPQSAIGQLAIYARRKGETWYLAALNGTEPTHIKIPLSFLGNGQYKAFFVKDSINGSPMVTIDSSTVKRKQAITIQMLSGGGFIGRFEKD